MKTKIFLSILALGFIISAFSQNTIELTFTADDNAQHVPLNSILIENLTQGGDTTLYAPDTVLVLDYVVGIGDGETITSNVFTVFQNYPNPMKGKTTVSLYLPENEDVSITISDIMGRELIHRKYHLDRGTHYFTFFSGKESLYFLTAQVNQKSRTVKMFNSPSHSSISVSCKLDYIGIGNDFQELKSETNSNNFFFSLGDLLKFTASTGLGERTITSSPTGDQTYYFHYTGDPCSGAPTVTDIDGNAYNTVQIGTQCWMKENLKTTTYSNGTSIPNVTNDDAWSNLTTGAYVWYDNDISWKDKYDALYNWFTTVDPNGLCPTGWHVPTNDEWTALTDFIGGTSSPHGNELKSCRQVNSPLGGGCSTSEHPRWNEHGTHYGTDDYGFSGLPGGYRHYDGYFDLIGSHGIWWSSTESSSNYARYRGLGYSYGYVYNYMEYDMRDGHSVRCLRDF